MNETQQASGEQTGPQTEHSPGFTDRALDAAARFVELRKDDAVELLEEAVLALEHAGGGSDNSFLAGAASRLSASTERLRQADAREALRDVVGWGERNHRVVTMAAAAGAALLVQQFFAARRRSEAPSGASAQ